MVSEFLEAVSELQADRILFLFLVIVLMLLCTVTTALVRQNDDAGAAMTLGTLTPTVSPTDTPALLTVHYELDVGEVDRALTVQIWHTSGAEGQNQRESFLTAGAPFSRTVGMPPGAHVALAGFLGSDVEGELTCRIMAGGRILEASTSQGTAAGVYCEGAVPSRR